MVDLPILPPGEFKSPLGALAGGVAEGAAEGMRISIQRQFADLARQRMNLESWSALANVTKLPVNMRMFAAGGLLRGLGLGPDDPTAKGLLTLLQKGGDDEMRMLGDMINNLPPEIAKGMTPAALGNIPMSQIIEFMNMSKDIYGMKTALSLASDTGGSAPAQAPSQVVTPAAGTPSAKEVSPAAAAALPASTAQPVSPAAAPVSPTGGGAGVLGSFQQATHQQESSGRPHDYQIQPDTFARYARPGEKFENPADHDAVFQRMTQKFQDLWPNDPERWAVAYRSGESNVSPPGSPRPFITDAYDPKMKEHVSEYIPKILGKMGVGAATAGAPVGPAQAVPSGTAQDVSRNLATGSTVPPGFVPASAKGTGLENVAAQVNALRQRAVALSYWNPSMAKTLEERATSLASQAEFPLNPQEVQMFGGQPGDVMAYNVVTHQPKVIRQAPLPQTQITYQQENLLTQGMAKETLDEAGATNENARTAASRIEMANNFESAISTQGGFRSGAFSDARLAIGRLAEFLGAKDDRGVPLGTNLFNAPKGEVAETITKQIAGEFANKIIKGRFSGQAQGFVEDMSPELMKTPEGNRILAQIFRRSAQSDLDQQNLQGNWLTGDPATSRNFRQRLTDVRGPDGKTYSGNYYQVRDQYLANNYSLTPALMAQMKQESIRGKDVILVAPERMTSADLQKVQAHPEYYSREQLLAVASRWEQLNAPRQ